MAFQPRSPSLAPRGEPSVPGGACMSSDAPKSTVPPSASSNQGGDLALLRQTQLVLLDRTVAADDIGVYLVGDDNVWKRQVQVPVAIVIDLNLEVGVVDGFLKCRQPALIEDASLERSLQHEYG